jgi:cytochrome P450
MTAPDPTPPGFAAPWTAAGNADPYPWFEYMLRERPVAYDAERDIWHIFRYGDVQEFLGGWDDWSTAKRLEQVPPDQRVVRLLTSDPPEHSRLRGLCRHAYRPRRVAALEPVIRQSCRDLLMANLERGRFDVVADFAAPLTAIVICQILGVPLADNEELQRKFRVVLSQVARGEGGGSALYLGGTPAAETEVLRAHFDRLIRDRREDPQDDLLSDLATKTAVGLPDDDVDVATLLNEQRNAGQNTTVHLIASMIAFLAQQPDQLELLRDRPELAELAVEETARYSCPLQARPRISTREMTIDGITIPAGSTGLAWLQSANLDPTVFADPLRYDVTRAPNHHIAFGWGEHFCIGAKLGRLECVIAIEEWLRLVGDYRLLDQGPLHWSPDFVLRGLEDLTVDVVPR